MRRFLLLLIYGFVFTPIGIAMRIFRDPLRRKLERSADTYWIIPSPRELAAASREKIPHVADTSPSTPISPHCTR